ncbi:hypothetical protein G7Z17_g5061 [Cylindrodendrum hubeiense]|uniref:Uncharacterized protein n=1 Tax=Cylindrodendrum hubeiense TaxID=595255 RepID=A0A9P5LHQ2_9HYPO|nr:hypothetical protein G7Z17_g5061 [Cylindrodendrum hubeiense]
MQIALGRLLPSARNLIREDFLEFLATLARDLPDWWVCEQCVKLHRSRKFDNSKRIADSRCSRTPRSNSYYWMNSESRLCHQHVQLALKYARMDNRKWAYQKYLDAVLAPRHMTTGAKTPGLKYRASYYPKIVKGRFLILGVLRFEKNKNVVSADTIRHMTICMHQYFCVSDLILLERLQALNPQPPLNPTLALSTAIGAGLKNEGVEARGFCPQCPTDFSFRATPNRAALCFWQDLGPEGSPLNLTWRVHVDNTSSADNPIIVCHKEPGSIRSLYESGFGKRV